jgi:hypothetical protein
VLETNALLPVPGSSITNPAWLRTQIDLAAHRYRIDRRPTLGVLWWYSASSVLLGPAVQARDPWLDRVTLLLHPDGRVLDARSDTVLDDPSLLGKHLADTLSTSIGAVSRCTTAAQRALWAIATDSLANRVLWSGGTPSDAERLAAAVGPALPKPRFTEVHGRLLVRRVSCCLIYESPNTPKCASCPRQHPADRRRRLERL